MRNINLPAQPDVVDAIAVYENGKELVLVQKNLRDGQPSRCLFFDEIAIDNCIVRLRLDFKDIDDNGHPVLDADVVEDGKKLKVARKRKRPVKAV